MTHLLSHRRTHNLLLIDKLLHQRGDQKLTSPFTLVLDTLEQSARSGGGGGGDGGTGSGAGGLLKEYVVRAKSEKRSKTHVIYLSFETVKRQSPAASQAKTKTKRGWDWEAECDSFVSCYGLLSDGSGMGTGLAKMVQIVRGIVASGSNANANANANGSRRYLILIDSLHALCAASLDAKQPLDLAGFLSSLLAPVPPAPPAPPVTTTQTQTQISLVAVYHTDIPPPTPPPPHLAYQPSPLTLLTYLATTIITVHSLPTMLAAKEAQERSQIPPSYGLSEEKEGIVIGLKSKTSPSRTLRDRNKGIILELEHRRKSGRGVREWYFLPTTSSSTSTSTSPSKESIILLDDHPLFKKDAVSSSWSSSDQQDPTTTTTGLTFELGLTDRQKLERDGVVLPYFDAQRGDGLAGPGEGGRILYDMGSEDDFDEEEDEI